MPSPTHVIVAGNHRQAREWCRWHDVDYRTTVIVTSDDDARRLYGHKFTADQVVFVGTWDENRMREIPLVLNMIAKATAAQRASDLGGLEYLRTFGCSSAGCDHEAYASRGLHAPNCTQSEFDLALEEIVRLRAAITKALEWETEDGTRALSYAPAVAAILQRALEESP